MGIRARLYTAIAVTVAGLAATAGVGIWALYDLSDRFGGVRRSSDDRALALQLKFDVTDFNGWQTAYGYDEGKSRPIFLRTVARFRVNLARAKTELTDPDERRLLGEVDRAFQEFMRLDRVAFATLQAGRFDEVRRLFLGPEIVHFQHAARAAEELAQLEAARASIEERRFEDARADALKILLIAAIVTALFVAILLVTATDLVRRAERALGAAREPGERG